MTNNRVFHLPFVLQNVSLKIINFYFRVPQIVSMRYSFAKIKIKVQGA